MKRAHILPIIVLLLVLTVPAYAHPGKTDANGGHYNRSTGEYHYHHGHPEHQHIDGFCPYEYDDRTGQNSGTSSGGSASDDRIPSVQRNTDSSESGTKGSRSNTSNKSFSVTMFWVIVCVIIFFAYGVPYILVCVNAIWGGHTTTKPLTALCKNKGVSLSTGESSPAQQGATKKRPHRLDLSNRFEVICGNRSVALYGLPGIRISHVGYLRDTHQLFIRFRDDNSVLVYCEVPLSVCSEFVRSNYPDEYYDTFIDRHFHVQRLR